MTNTFFEPTFPISKIENFDEDNILFLQRSDKLSKQVKNNLSNYSKHRVSGGKLSTTYKIADNCAEFSIGRLYPIDNLSMSGMRFDVRNPLAEKYYWDIDMENAHYRIALQYCITNNLPHENIQKYVVNRDAMLKCVSSSRKKAKTEFLKILYGGDIKLYNTNYDETEGDISNDGFELLKSLQTEVCVLMDIIWTRNSHLHLIKTGAEKKQLNKLPIHKAKATLMSLIFQTEERKLLMFIDSFMKTKNRSMDVFIHDGGYIRKLEGESCFPEELLIECSKEILAVMKYDIPLAQKPISYEPLDFIAKNDYYANKKIEIEKRYAQLGGNFIEINEEEEPTIISAKDLKMMFKMFNYKELNIESGKMVKTYFFDKWTDDINHKSYSKMDFIPKIENCPAKVYNLFNGFKAEKLEGMYEYDEELIQPIINHMDLLTEKNKSWLLEWLACKIQQPWRKTQVIPLFRDVEGFLELCGGTGKTTFLDWFGSEILGEKYYLSIQNNEEFYNSFNGHFEGKLLINLEEAEGSTHHKNDNILKARATASKMTINKKSINQYKVNDYADIVASTNTKNPFKVNLSNRRIASFDVDATHRNDPEYFKTLLGLYKNKQAIYSFYIYLRDVVVVPEKFDIPKTKANADMTSMNTQIEYKWITNLVRSFSLVDMYSKDAYEDFSKFCSSNKEGKSSMTMTAFGIMLNNTPLIEKKRDKKGVLLQFKTDLIVSKMKILGLLEPEFQYEKPTECLIEEDEDALSTASTAELFIDGILQAN